MKITTASKLILASCAPAIAILMTACSGLPSSSSSSSSGSSSTPVTVALNQSAVNVTVGASQQFTATVTGSSNTSVTWSVDGVSGGNSTVGTINASGKYIAPASPGKHTVTATSVAQSSSTAQASVSVVNTLSVSPSSATVNGGLAQAQQFSASDSSNANVTVNWSVDGVAGGNSSVGKITASGLYTPPNSAGNHTIMAANSTDAEESATAAVTVYVMTISPLAVTLAPSGTKQFTATVQGLSSSTVNWSVDGIAGGNSSTGTVSSSGLYTAPSTGGTSHTVTATSTVYSAATVSASVTVSGGSGGGSTTSVYTYHNDDARSGANTHETLLTTANVNSASFGKILSYPVDGQVYAQPLVVSGLTISGVKHDVVFVETQNNSVYAFDADATAATPTTFWHINLGPSVTKNDVYGVNPVVGILGTPVIDANTNVLYLVAETSNTGTNGTPFFLHALDITTGAEEPGSPIAINATDPNSTATLGTDCYQRMGLALSPLTHWVYIPFGSCSHGWVVAYDETSLAQEAVFNDTSNALGGGFWAGGGAPAIDDTNGNVYLMSGSDSGDQVYISQPPNYTQTGYNNSFLYLSGNALTLQSYFSPNNNWALADNDADLGSGAAALVPGNSDFPSELIGGGKDGNVYVVDPLMMGGFSGTNDVVQTVHVCNNPKSNYDNIFSTPAYWNGSIYYHCDNDAIRAFNWNATASSGSQLSTAATSVGKVIYSTNDQTHGAIVSVSSNGNSNGIVWDTDNSNFNLNNPAASGPLVLHAYDATNVATELYNSSQASGGRDTAGLALKFTVPTIVNGRVYVPTGNELDVYGLLP